jgi:hypothetical protein
MQNAAGGSASAQSDARNDAHRSIVSDLKSLIDHVRASMKLIELVIAREASAGNQEIAAGVVVLDDVTPRYVKVNAALSACHAGLGVALHYLLDAKASKHATDESGGCGRGPVRLIGSA